MSYPTAGDYQEALQVPEAAFVDPELRAGEPEAGPLGLPRVVTGAYAAVFPVRTRTGRRAVKCFLTDVPDAARRYRAVAAHLETADLHEAVPFEYQPEGLRLDGRTLPLVKMPWVEGRPLDRFVETHRGDPEAMRTLADAWRRLVARLEASGMAHGDLQHGNVLVAGDPHDPRLRLVDFDTAYVPALDGRRSPEVGHRNYQHPDRDEQDYGPQLDRFAALVVYTALVALAEHPALWDHHATGENLLFRAADFYDPAGSTLFDALRRLDAARRPAEHLRRACLLPPEAVPPLTDVLAGTRLPEVPPGRPSRRRPGGRTTAPQPARRGLVALLFAAAMGAGVFVGAAAGIALLVVGLGLVTLTAWRHHRRRPAVRRRRRLEREAAYYRAAVRVLDEEVARLDRARREAVHGMAARRRERLAELRERALYDRLKYHFIHEAGAVDGVSHKVVVRLKAAGLRTAHDVTPEGLARVREVGEASRRRLLDWRRALADSYAAELPDALSPAQDRRLETVLRHRLRELDAERRRALEKRRVQREEQADVLARLGTVPRRPFGHTLAAYLGLGPPSGA